MTNLTLGDKHFQPLISNARILGRINELAIEINSRLSLQDVDILVILDGAEVFAKAIIPLFSFKYVVHFIKIKTYEGMNSGSIFKLDLSVLEKLKSKDVLILEDIIDSGFTVHQLLEKLKERDIHKIHLATLLLKPDQLKYRVKPDFTGFEIGSEFVVGFGMDYNEQGRDLLDIYNCINP